MELADADDGRATRHGLTSNSEMGYRAYAY
jgi:hypothetical protein